MLAAFSGFGNWQQKKAREKGKERRENPSLRK